jgi:hypothetical protein
MSRIVAAVLLALLSVIAPAHATFVTLESVDLNFGNGYQAIGDFSVTSHGNGSSSSTIPFLYFDSSPLPVFPTFNSVPGHTAYGNPPPFGQFDFAFINDGSPNFAPSTFSDFSLNGTVAESGSVSCVATFALGSPPNGTPCAFTPSPTPLPDALPMFGAALLGFMGFAAWRSRRAVRG